jgi:drug/metabolite transporter (DMT)-like permease
MPENKSEGQYTMNKEQKSHYIGIIYLLITIILFSTFEVTSKFLAPYMNPIQITFSRFLIGGMVLLPFALLRLNKKQIKLSLKDFFHCGLLGLINIVISMGLIQLGLVYTNASVCAVLFSVNPLFVVLFAKFLLGEKITINKIVGLILGVLGVIILFIDSIYQKTSTLLGLILILSSAMFFALYTVMGKKVINNRIDSLITTTFSFLIGSMLLMPVQILLRISFFPNVSNIVPQLLYMSIVVTGIAYVLYFKGLSRLEAGAGSMLYFAKPAIASILAILLLNEHPGVNLFIGIVIIAMGIFLSQFNTDQLYNFHKGK